MSISDEKIDAVWAQIPKIECKGLCHDSCTIINMSDSENNRIWRKHGFNLSGRIFSLLHRIGMNTAEPICPALDKETKRCTIYEDRPFVCRVYGVTKALKCSHGCVPKEWLGGVKATKLKMILETIGKK